jgi:hypothetical protein
MSGSFTVQDGQMTITKDGRIVFDTSRPLMNLVPSAAIEVINIDIEWPNLWRGVIYHQIRETQTDDNSGPIDFGDYWFSCASFVGLVPQEWGPGRANNIDDIVLGTVPAGTDYLDVMVNLTNTVVPDGYFDLAMQSTFPPGEWVKLEGGSCGIETFPGFVRKFDIVLDGTDVVLKRYQSVGNATGAATVARNFNSAAEGNAVQWIAGTNAGTGGANAIYGGFLQSKGPTGTVGNATTHRPPGVTGSNDPCTTTPSSYASTWSGDILITPGRIS